MQLRPFVILSFTDGRRLLRRGSTASSPCLPFAPQPRQQHKPLHVANNEEDKPSRGDRYIACREDIAVSGVGDLPKKTVPQQSDPRGVTASALHKQALSLHHYWACCHMRQGLPARQAMPRASTTTSARGRSFLCLALLLALLENFIRPLLAICAQRPNCIPRPIRTRHGPDNALVNAIPVVPLLA